MLTPEEEHVAEDRRSVEEETIEIDEGNSSVIGEQRSNASVKSEVSFNKASPPFGRF